MFCCHEFRQCGFGMAFVSTAFHKSPQPHEVRLDGMNQDDVPPHLLGTNQWDAQSELCVAASEMPPGS